MSAAQTLSPVPPLTSTAPPQQLITAPQQVSFAVQQLQSTASTQQRQDVKPQCRRSIPPRPTAASTEPTSQLNDPAQRRQPNVASTLTPSVAETLHNMSHTTSSNDISQSFSLEELEQVNHDNDFLGDNDLLDDDDHGAVGPTGGTANVSGAPTDWNGVSPNHVMGRLKLLKQEVLEQHGLCPYFKSYTNWEKMTAEQQNKAVAWFQKLPDPLKGNVSCCIMFSFLRFWFVY